MYAYQPSVLYDTLETFMSAEVVDGKGREVGVTIGLRDNGRQFFAWVQNSRREKGYFYTFGMQQPAREFHTQREAMGWAYRVARERIAKVREVRIKYLTGA